MKQLTPKMNKVLKELQKLPEYKGKDFADILTEAYNRLGTWERVAEELSAKIKWKIPGHFFSRNAPRLGLGYSKRLSK